MNILNLDEAQGLTEKMVREYLERQEWTYDGRVDSVTGWRRGKDAFTLCALDLHYSLDWLARKEGRSVQALLRDINPRMRRGVPSEAAKQAHSMSWVGRSPYGGIMIGQWDGPIFRRDAHGFASSPEEWSFWPCDAHGNKVRWPERDGVML